MFPDLIVKVESLEPEHFIVSSNAAIFDIVRRMQREGSAVDLVTVVERLRCRGQLEILGGDAYLGSLLNGGFVETNVPAYAREIIRHAQQRSLLKELEKLAEFASNPAVSLSEIDSRIGDIYSARVKEATAAESSRLFQTAVQVAERTPETVTWIAPPFVAAGAITEMSGKIKLAGKTTLATHLVRAVLEGDDFLGQQTTKSPVVYLTEQSAGTFRVALERANLLSQEELHVHFAHNSRGMSWSDLVGRSLRKCMKHEARLLVVDTLGQFANLTGDAESKAGEALEAMRPLQEAASHGLGVIVVRHERKSGGEVGDSARGSSAFGGAADILLSVRRAEGNNGTVRVIQALSRFSETPSETIVDLTPEGYILRDRRDVKREEAENAVLAVLPRSAESAMKEKEIEEATRKPRTTLQAAYKALQQREAVVRLGKGSRGDPYRWHLL